MKNRSTVIALMIVALSPGLRPLHARPERTDEGAEAGCPMMAEHAAGVDERGDQGMGFDHAETTHHFLLAADGGAIQVTANDPADTSSRDQIRGHLRRVAAMFGDGNFSIPIFVHAQVPPGVPVMRRSAGKIAYLYEETGDGGRVRIRTADPEALAAVHDFLRFQIRDHRTGDPLEPPSR
jgi:hypothetical protein